jgi:hypothetical protein
VDQLAALADTLQTGAEFLIDVDDSVANAELIDEVYRRAGLSPRGKDDTFSHLKMAGEASLPAQGARCSSRDG